MAYDSTVPDLANLIEDDIPAIKENFVQLADSRIVDDNLDVASPSNGYYVQWDNGLMIVWDKDENEYVTENSFSSFYITFSQKFTFPVSFISEPKVIPLSELTTGSAPSFAGMKGNVTNIETGGIWAFSANSSAKVKIYYIAIGRWK